MTQRPGVTPKCPADLGFDYFSPGEAQEAFRRHRWWEEVKGRPLKGLPTSCFRSPPLLPGLCDVNSFPHALMPSSESPRPLLWHVGLKLPENMDSNKDPSPKFSMSGHRNVKVNSTFSSPTVFPKYCARKTNKQTKTSWNSISRLELFRLSSWRRFGSTGTSSKPVASTAL